MQSHFQSSRTRQPGFTLVELLVVIAIVAVLATIGMVGAPKYLEKARRVTALAQIKDVSVGFAAYEAENNRPLLPPQLRQAGQDTVYGDAGGELSNIVVVAVLGGSGENLHYSIASLEDCAGGLKVNDISRSGEAYMVFKTADKKKNGVGPDGLLYDPWGRQWMFAINAFNAPDTELVAENPTTPGKNDSMLFTKGLATYSDTKPREESWVMWTYGKDGKKGGEATRAKKVPPYNGADDVASWK